MCVCYVVVQSLKSCLTLCNPMDYSLPGSSVHGILQARILEGEGEVAQLCPMDCSPPGSSVHGILQARILEWVAFSSPGDLPDPGSPAFKIESLLSEPPGKPSKQVIFSSKSSS